MSAPTPAGCTGKKAYQTFTRADSSAKRLRRNRDDAHVTPYHCKACHKFHVGENNEHGKRAHEP